jgi:long-chain-fatty-acid--CoA ligase ACSBG
MKGRNVMMGYLGSPDKTAETITESGWLRSGDLGHGDESGFYRITGRAKEILITSGGENIAPTPIEEAIKKQLPCVSNALLIGDKRKYLTCLLTLKTEVNPETLEPLPQLSAPTLEWCNNIGSKAKVMIIVLK